MLVLYETVVILQLLFSYLCYNFIMVFRFGLIVLIVPANDWLDFFAPVK